MHRVGGLLQQVADALQVRGIAVDGPHRVAATQIPTALEPRVPQQLRDAWHDGAWRLSWHDHDGERLGRDARHGGLLFMTPAEAAAEAEDYAELLEEERDVAEPANVELAERSWLTWTPFHRFPSGDCLAVDRSGEVVLWQHDLLDGGPYVHGLRLGTTLTDFVGEWARVGFAEPRDWRKVATVQHAGLDLNGAEWTRLF